MDATGQIPAMDELESQLQQVMRNGALDEIDADELARLLGEDAREDLERLNELAKQLESAGFLRKNGDKLELEEEDSAPFTVTGSVDEDCQTLLCDGEEYTLTGKNFSFGLTAAAEERKHELERVDLAGNSSKPIFFDTERLAPGDRGTVCPQCETPRKNLQAKFCSKCRHKYQ